MSFSLWKCVRARHVHIISYYYGLSIYHAELASRWSCCTIQSLKKTKRIDTQLWLLYLTNLVCELDVRACALCIDMRADEVVYPNKSVLHDIARLSDSSFPLVSLKTKRAIPGLEVLATVTFTKHLGYLKGAINMAENIKANIPEVPDMKLELVPVPVSDVD